MKTDDKFKKFIAPVLVLAISCAALADNVTLMTMRMGGSHVLDLLKHELSLVDANSPKHNVGILDIPTSPNNSPFPVTGDGFHMGTSRPSENEKPGPVELADPNEQQWFSIQDKQGKRPDAFFISGHQIAGLGFHGDDLDNDYYKKSLYLPAFIETIEQNPAARELFDNVKIAFVGGCNGMVNFEPHGENGQFLNSAEISRRYHADDSGKQSVIGSLHQPNTLEFYRHRIGTLYSDDTTLNPDDEDCKLDNPPDHCETMYVNRVLPDYGLFDGSHMYNYPYQMKRVFRNAVLVLGFEGASALNDTVARMLKKTLDDSRNDINDGLHESDSRYINNVLLYLVRNDADLERKKQLIQIIRAHWTLETFRGEGIEGGSITPAFPDLDASGPYIVQASAHTPMCAPYEERDAAPACTTLPPQKFVRMKRH